MTKLIAMNGFKGAGKDTAAEAVTRLMHSLGYLVERRGFADRMKIISMRAIFGNRYSDNELIAAANDLKSDGGGVVVNFPGWLGGRSVMVPGRKYYQQLGTEALRDSHDQDFHVDALLPWPGGPYDHIENVKPSWYDNFHTEGFPDYDIAVVTDCRFVNEAQRVYELGGEVWEIVREGIETDGHSSEIPLPRDLVTLTIHNDESTRIQCMHKIMQNEATDYAHRHGLEMGRDMLPFSWPDRPA